MADPPRYITISDFSPGIWGDIHAADTVRSTADDDLAGTIPTNGAARASGTVQCKADKTGALVPMPKPIEGSTSANALEIDMTLLSTARPDVYLLDAQIGLPESYGTQKVDPEDTTLYLLWGFFTKSAGNAYVSIRGHHHRIADPTFSFTFLTTRTIWPYADTVAGDLTADNLRGIPLPIGSLCNTRFYYGYTTPGLTAAGADNAFRARWWYPVTVALAAMPFPRYETLLRHQTGAIDFPVLEPASAFPPGGGASTTPYTYFSPAIGGAGAGNAIIAMNFNNGDTTNLPLNSAREDVWYFHYNDASHAHGEDLDEAINNPYLLIAHQQRIVMPDRRRSAPYSTRYALASSTDLRLMDDLLWYSDVALPMQDFDLSAPANTYDYTTDDTPPGITNTGYQTYPAVIQSAYNKLNVADDVIAEVGVIGVVNYDQLLVVKHNGGGAVVSGDLDSPVIRRLPYIEPTGGLIMKGCPSPLGFVYGSPNGIFVWQGGEQSEKISNQIDGFFWDHTDGSENETYGGARGRFAYWNSMVYVPNNYCFDVERQSWWRVRNDFLATQTASLVEISNTPFNCYDTFERTLFAFPYRVTANGQATPATHLWVTFDSLTLDSAYTWQSHPLLETRGRTQQFQEIRLVATGHSDSNASIKVTLEGFDQQGNRRVTTETTFDLTASDEPQYLRKDVAPNFTAQYVTVSIDSRSNDEDVPAPKIHSVHLGVSDRALTPRHG